MVEKKIEKLSFEEAIKELESIVMRLESSNIALDEAIELYNRGSELQKHCKVRLMEAKLKVEQIITQANGEVALAPANNA